MHHELWDLGQQSELWQRVVQQLRRLDLLLLWNQQDAQTDLLQAGLLGEELLQNRVGSVGEIRELSHRRLL